MAHEAGLAMQKNEEKGDNVPNVQQHETGELHVRVNKPRNVKAMVALFSSSTLSQSTPPQVKAGKFNALSENLEAGCSVVSEKARISCEEVPVIEDLSQEVPGSLLKKAMDGDFENADQDRGGSGKESNEEDEVGSKHPEDTEATHGELSSLSVQGEQLGLGTAINDDVDNEAQQSDESGTELYEDVEDDLEHDFGSMHQENIEDAEQSSLSPQSEEQDLSMSLNGSKQESVVERPIVELERRAPVEEELYGCTVRTEESNDKLDLISGDDDADWISKQDTSETNPFDVDADWRSKQDTAEVIDGGMKGVLELSQKDSIFLKTDKDDSLEKQESIVRHETDLAADDADWRSKQDTFEVIDDGMKGVMEVSQEDSNVLEREKDDALEKQKSIFRHEIETSLSNPSDEDAGWRSKQGTSEVIDDGMKRVLEGSEKDSNVLERDKDDSLEKQESIFRHESETSLSNPSDKDAGWRSKQDTSEVIDDGMKGVLERSETDSNVLERDKDDSLEKQESIFRHESENPLSDPSDLPSRVIGPVMATDNNKRNSLEVEEVEKTGEIILGQDSGVAAGTTAGEVLDDLQEQCRDVTRTLGDVDKRESFVEEALSKPLEIAVESGSEKVAVSETLELPISARDCAETLESNHVVMNGTSDASLAQEFHEQECNKVINEASSVALKQAISLEKEVDLAGHCNEGATQVCQSSLEWLNADDSQALEVSSLGEEIVDYRWCAEIQNHEDSFQSEVKLPSQTKNAAMSSDQQFEQGLHHDKDGGSSLDSTAGSSWKLCETEPQTQFEDANSSGSEDSASSPAHTQPSPQQRKKRIDLSHQFVRKIVKIQHDREQYDREQSEKQSQAQQFALAKSNAIQEQRSNLVEKRQVRKSPGKEFMHRRPSERGSDRHIKELQPTHNTKGKRSVPPQVKSASTQFREGIHEGNLQGQVTFSEAEGSLEGNQPGKTGPSKQDRFMPIYRPPSARESLAASLDEQNSMAESEFPFCSFIVHSSPDSSTSSVLESPVISKGVTKVGEDKGMLTVVKSSSGERYVHYVESQEQQTTLKGMNIKVTFDTEKRQRHIVFSDVERARQQKQMEKMSPASFDYNHGLDYCPSFDLSRSPDIHSVLIHSPQASSSFTLSSSPALSQGKVRSSGTPLTAKGKFTHQTERGTPSWDPFHAAHDDVSPSIPFQLQLDKRSHRMFEGKHGFSEQADIPVKLQEPYSWLSEAPSGSMHLSTGGTIHNTSGGKMRRSSQSSREVHMQNSSLRIPATAVSSNSTPVGHSWSSSHRRERPTDSGDNESINQWTNESIKQWATPQIPQFDLPFAEMMNSDVRGKPKIAAITDRSNDRRQSKYKNMVKDYTLPSTAQVEGPNPSMFTVNSQSHLATGISQSEVEAKGEKQRKVPSLHDVNQRNIQEGIDSGRGVRSDATRKGSTQISKSHLSPLSVDGGTLHTATLLGKWGDIVDDSPDAYDYLQMTVQDNMAEGAEGPEPRTRSYNYGSPSNSGLSDVANSKNENVMSKGSSKYRGIRNHGFSDNEGQQKNKAPGEVVEAIFGPPVNENRVRRSVWERLGPQNVSGPSILGPPPRVLDNRVVEKASDDAFSGKISDMKTNRSFEFGVQGSALDSHGLRFSSVSHDSPYNAELDAFRNDECTEVVVQAYKDSAQKRSKRELYVPRRGL